MIPSQKIMLLTFISAFLVSAVAQAEGKKPTVIYNYSCKAGETAGLRFNGNDWEQARFKPQKDFYLTLKTDNDGYELTVKHQTFDYKCKVHSELEPLTLALMGVSSGNYNCMDGYGRSIIFDKNRNRGGISFLLGAVDKENTKKDDLVVYPFMCVSLQNLINN